MYHPGVNRGVHLYFRDGLQQRQGIVINNVSLLSPDDRI
jgi:hypothetical protein